jgi:hypothetical protein
MPDVLSLRFTWSQPNQAWVGDITYVRTARGWAFLALPGRALCQLKQVRSAGRSSRATCKNEPRLICEAMGIPDSPGTNAARSPQNRRLSATSSEYAIHAALES